MKSSQIGGGYSNSNDHPADERLSTDPVSIDITAARRGVTHRRKKRLKRLEVKLSENAAKIAFRKALRARRLKKMML